MGGFGIHYLVNIKQFAYIMPIGTKQGIIGLTYCQQGLKLFRRVSEGKVIYTFRRYSDTCCAFSDDIPQPRSSISQVSVSNRGLIHPRGIKCS